MKRFLFVMVEGGGNVPAQMSIARRLAIRGHEVHVLADRPIEREALKSGCRFHTFVHAPQNNMRDRREDVIRDWEPATPPAQVRRIGERLMFGPAAAYARDVIETVERVRPDALAVDCLSFGAIAGAEKSGIPSALLIHFLIHPPVDGVTPFGLGLHPARGPLERLRDRALRSVMRRMFAFGLAPLNEARRQLELPPLRDVFDQFLTPRRRLVLTSRAYDFVPSPLPEQVRYVGPQLDDPLWPEQWTSPWSENSPDPLVAVSLGSTYQRQEKTFSAIIDALGRLPVRGFATLGEIGPPPSCPPNVVVARSAPHAAVLPLASAVVCHGGHGTVMKALAHGLPVLVMPFGRDQKDNGARVEVAEAGLSLPPGSNPARIARAIRRLIEEPHFRQAAQRLAVVIARDVKEDRAVFEMEALASAHSAQGINPDPHSTRGAGSECQMSSV
jgi:MGT family glycosyltransferase